MSERASQIEGPAKWAAVAVLGSAGIIGIGRSFFVDTVHAPPTASLAAPVRIEPTPATPERDVPAAEIDPKLDAEPPPLSGEDEIEVTICVNSASAAELDLLPGIGPVYAQRIVEERDANGPYDSLEDLQRVRGIGPKTAEKLGPLVRFDRP